MRFYMDKNNGVFRNINRKIQSKWILENVFL